jgi:4-alpha-glucanotransferase
MGGFMEFPEVRHYLTGIAVPVSALRSGKGCGTGEFLDLVDLGAWCADRGIDLIQILPVNDTGFQPSPYGALSAFALHPLYLRLTRLPEASGFIDEINETANEFNPAPRLEHARVLTAKLGLLRKIYAANAETIAADSALMRWIGANPWIDEYAVFMYLRESHGGSSWTEWPELQAPERKDIQRIWGDAERRSEVLFHAWVQWRLEEQLVSAAKALNDLGVSLKGDLPIMMNDDSADVWYRRRLFNRGLSAGAPPDGFAPYGQNWGFPVYDWEALKAEDYDWWKRRLLEADKFYNAFRIDHVLGFFRIWATPQRHETAYLGHFMPAEPIHVGDLSSLGFDAGRTRWLSEPHLPTAAIREAIAGSGEIDREAAAVFAHVLDRVGTEELWVFKPEIRGGKDLRQLPLREETKNFLADRFRDRSLLEVGSGRYLPSFRFRDSSAWKTLSDAERERLEALFSRKTAVSESVWEEHGRTLLSMLAGTTGMLPCAEDLGAIPDCVPRVLGDLGVLGLRVNRWAREWNRDGQPFIALEALPFLSVCTPSVHDTSTLREWWENDNDKWPFWDQIVAPAIAREAGSVAGGCPSSYSPETAARVIGAITSKAASVLCVFQIQDLLDLDQGFYSASPESERINIPGSWNDFNWSYRMPITIEELMKRKNLNKTISSLTKARRDRPFETRDRFSSAAGSGKREFHISAEARERYDAHESLFELDGNVILANFRAVRELAQSINEKREAAIHPERAIRAGQLNAMGLIDEIMHSVVALYREKKAPDALGKALARIGKSIGKPELDRVLLRFVETFPPKAVYFDGTGPKDYLAASTDGTPNREIVLEELLMLFLENDDPAFGPFADLFDDTVLGAETAYAAVIDEIKAFFAGMPAFGPDDSSLFEMLKSPVYHAPHSLPGQLEYIRTRWGSLLGPYLLRLLSSLDLIKEEEKPSFPGPGPTRVYVYSGLENEYERFSRDKDWMPRVILIAKSTLVWLSQLTRTYDRPITRLDQIPDEELDAIAERGFTSLWLIGLWERSAASRRIKEICGNPEAAASAYSLFDYDIAAELGGWDALKSLKERCAWRGIRLAADMVPNHSGIDSRWVREKPDLFMQLPYPPFPGYSFNGEDLSGDSSVGIFLEDHYYSRSDAAVVFKRVDRRTGDTRYIYHGNDGTSMPWNDTAQIDFLNPEAREAVIAKIVEVAKLFPVIRFDAAMVLAKKHVKRLWYPEPGSGGSIASRAEHALGPEEFDARMPAEFWREVVDRCAREAPDSLLLAEAFWMLEGYFVRTLGMHRVYNSAFMNMLKREENEKYRSTIKNTMEFDPEIMKRFVNFMNNPDEDTAVAQFGKGDKYFGVCTMMVTMPGLPMFGHGQIEGFEEKYGMEYRRAYRDEEPDESLVFRHYREIFPLMKKRYIFADVGDFLLYDLFADSGSVNENVFAYSNRAGGEAALVLYNNAFDPASGWIRMSAAFAVKKPDGTKNLEQRSVGQGLGLEDGPGRFLIFREQRAGLWFVRSSRDIVEKGLFIALNGYECQVFLDIQEIADNELGQYRTLCDALGGRGVIDIQNALQDIVLAELYADFRKAFPTEFFEKARAIAAASATGKPAGKPARSKSIAALIAVTKPEALKFFQTASRFIRGTAQYAAFPVVEPDPRLAPEAAWDILEAGLIGAFAAIEICGKAGADSGDNSFSAELAREILAKPETADYLLAFEVLASMLPLVGENADRASVRRLVDHWCIDRKLRETLQEAGHPGDEVYREVMILKAVLSFPALPLKRKTGTKKTKAKDAVAVNRARLAFENPEVRRLVGVNTYNDVVWFNRESFDAALFLAGAIAAVDVGDGTAARIRTKAMAVDGEIARVRKAEAESGYSVEAMLEALERQGSGK